MAKTLIFSKPVEKRLKELKIKNLVSKRIIEHWQRNKLPYERREELYALLKEEETVAALLWRGFTWLKTKETYFFWKEISKRNMD